MLSKHLPVSGSYSLPLAPWHALAHRREGSPDMCFCRGAARPKGVRRPSSSHGSKETSVVSHIQPPAILAPTQLCAGISEDPFAGVYRSSFVRLHLKAVRPDFGIACARKSESEKANIECESKASTCRRRECLCRDAPLLPFLASQDWAWFKLLPSPLQFNVQSEHAVPHRIQQLLCSTLFDRTNASLLLDPFGVGFRNLAFCNPSLCGSGDGVISENF